MNNYIQFLVILLSTFDVHSKRVKLEEYDMYELQKVTKYNDTRLKLGLEPVLFSRELMHVAQEEANRLNLKGKLETLAFKSPKSYRGFSVRITSQVGKLFRT